MSVHAVKRDLLAKALVMVGFKDAADFDDAKLVKKAMTLPKVVKEDQLTKLAEKPQSFVRGLIAAVQEGATVEISGAKAAAKTAEKTAPAAKKSEKAEKSKGPGVIDTIVSCLKGASKTSPVTKEDILKTLVKTCKDREEDKMKVTLNIQCPTRLNLSPDRCGGIIERAEGGGYYVNKSKK